jgi:hypothetical protein
MYQVGSELSVPKGPFKHVGTYIGNGRVFHCHPNTGEEIVSLSQFSSGRKITVIAEGVTDWFHFLRRLGEKVANPESYNLISNNCQHAASELRTGIKKSSQLTGVCAGILLVSTFILILRNR